MPLRISGDQRSSLQCLAKALALLLALTRLTVAQAPAVETPPTDGPATKQAAKAQAKPAPLGTKWVRLVRGEKQQPVAMQTAIVRYTGTPKAGGRPVTVDLIGAVHVGDSAYYTQLNKRFTKYQALLYELVAPEGTVIPKGAKASGRHPVGALQGGMKTFLELEHQLEKVDYTRPNFVHADMSPEEFFQTMNDRGESVMQMIFKMIGQGMAAESKQQADGKSTDAEIIVALFSKDRARRLKIVFAKQFDEMESMLTSFGGPGGSTIIHERNKKALKVLRKQIDSGRTNLGVFYGAGHLVDMHKRLVKDFNLKPESITWLTAWDLQKK